MKRRIVGPNRRSYTGRHVGLDQTEVRYESSLERDFLTLMRFRPDVISIREQPETFGFVDDQGQARRYTPDFEVIFGNKTVLYEIKYREELRKNWERYRGVVRFMRDHCAERGIHFRIMTDLTIRSVKFENVKLLSAHVKTPPHSAMSERLRRLLSQGPATVLEAVRSLCPAAEDRADFYAALWPLLARREIQMDWSKPIGMETRIWL